MDVYTDGSCLGNPGPGGWAYYIPQIGEQNSGAEARTTNNRMELVAIWQALSAVERFKQRQPTIMSTLEHKVLIYSDSLWAINCLNRTWRAQRHLELFNQVWITVRELHVPVIFEWVKGHNGVAGNELVDKLAHRAAIDIQARLR